VTCPVLVGQYRREGGGRCVCGKMRLARRAHRFRLLRRHGQPAPRGRLGTALVSVVTIVTEELEAAASTLGAQENIPGTAYHVREVAADGAYEFVLRKAVDRGNLAAMEVAQDVIEDFRPSFLLLVGIAGGVGGRDQTALGDVVLADFVQYSEMRKVQDGRSVPRYMPYDHPSINLLGAAKEVLE
jgi:adenosylhomocysteine nucleosidase